MKKSTDPYYVIKNKFCFVESKFHVFYSHKLDFFFLSLLLVLSIIFFKDVLTSDAILVHGDYRFALTVDEHIFHLLNNLPVHASKLPLSLILYPLKVVFGDTGAEKVFTMLTLFLSAAFVYIANRYMVSRFEGTKHYWLLASCFVGSLVFIYNPWTIHKIYHHYWLVVSVAASYLLIAVIDSYLHSNERNNAKRLMLMAFSASLVASQPQGLIIYFLPMLAIYLTVNLFINRSLILSKLAIKKISVLVIIGIACNLFWLIPAIQVLISTNGISAEGIVKYGLVEENVGILSRHGTIQNVLQGTSDYTWGDDSSLDPSIIIGRNVNSALPPAGSRNIDLWGGLLAFLPLSLIFLFFSIRRPIGKSIIYIVAFFSILVILSVILATGSYYNDIYSKFFLDFPLGESIRDPYKFSGLYFVAVSFFASVSLYRLDRKNLKKNIVIFSLMIGLIFSWGWVGLTGNVNGHLSKSIMPYPHDLSDVSEYLHSQYAISSSANGKIFWYPSEGANLLQYSSVPQLSTESLSNLELPTFQLNYIDYLINKNDTSVIPLFEYLGVEYLVIREDHVDNVGDNVDDNIGLESLEEMQTRVQNLRAMLYKNLVFESGRFEVYKLNTNSPVSMSHLISAGTDDLSKVATVAGESEYLNNIQLGPFLGDSLIVSGSPPPEFPDSAITVVDPTSKHHLPNAYWSIGSINGGWMNSITSYLNRSGIKTWQFDYNKGSIFTWGEKYSVSRFNLENAQPITRFDFNSLDEISQWGNSHPKYQSFELEEQPMLELPGEGKAMRVVLNTSNYGWKTITSPAFDVSSERVYVIKLAVSFINAQNVHLRITEFDKNGGIINSGIVYANPFPIGYWKDIKFSYRPFNNEVTSIALSISHGNLTKQPLPNILWIDSVRMYDVTDQVQENSISIPFKMNNHNNNYKVFVRYLESPEGGRFSAMLEGSLTQMSTLSSDSKFVWKDLGGYTLNQGNHNMTFTNEKGFNAINTILLIQKDQFEEIKGRIEDWLNQNSSDDVNNDSQNQMQLTTTISNKWWSSQKYEIKLNNITKPLIISLAEPFNPDLRAAIYTKDGLSKTENLIPLFYSLKSGIYIDTLATDTKVVIYDAEAPLQWFAISSLLSLASYVLLIVLANMKLTNRFKGSSSIACLK
jgi:hypothetical protein